MAAAARSLDVWVQVQGVGLERVTCTLENDIVGDAKRAITQYLGVPPVTGKLYQVLGPEGSDTSTPAGAEVYTVEIGDEEQEYLAVKLNVSARCYCSLALPSTRFHT